MKAPRGLTADEADAWARVALTVKRMHPAPTAAVPAAPASAKPAPMGATKPAQPTATRPQAAPPPRAAVSAPPPAPGLDSHWDRRIRSGAITPDFTLDLHGHTLAQAHARLDAGLAQAKALGARIVLVIAGKPRPVDAADRGERRGAIRAKLLDWLAAGPHGADVAAIRSAHRKHGGEGALYVVLRRPR